MNGAELGRRDAGRRRRLRGHGRAAHRTRAAEGRDVGHAPRRLRARDRDHGAAGPLDARRDLRHGGRARGPLRPPAEPPRDGRSRRSARCSTPCSSSRARASTSARSRPSRRRPRTRPMLVLLVVTVLLGRTAAKWARGARVAGGLSPGARGGPCPRPRSPLGGHPLHDRRPRVRPALSWRRRRHRPRHRGRRRPRSARSSGPSRSAPRAPVGRGDPPDAPTSEPREAATGATVATTEDA